MSRTALIGLVFVAALGACKNAPTPPAVVQGKSPVDSADQFMVGMTTMLNDKGVKRADISADTAYLYDNSTRVDMLGVQGSFFTSTGVKDGIMTARKAQYDTRVDSMQAWGDVTVISTDGKTLKTPYLRYNRAQNQISSDSVFTITSADQTVKGIGFDSDPGLNALVIRKSISGSAGKVSLPGR